MKILVPVKRVPDPSGPVPLTPDGRIDASGIRWVINPFDAAALEAAVRLRERGGAAARAEIVAVGIGEETLRAALARGADRALLVLDDGPSDPGVISRRLAAVVRRENPDLVLMGKQATDDDGGQIGPRLAAELALPQATFASCIELSPDGSHVRVTRAADAGRETLEITLPAVITVDLGGNEPRALALPAILRARTKPVERIASSDLGPRPPAAITILRHALPPPRPPCRKVRSVDELIAVLREESLTPRPGGEGLPRPGGEGLTSLLVLAETDGVRVLPGTLSALAFAQTLTRITGGGFDIVLAGGPEIAEAAEAWRGYGARRVRVAAAPELAHPTADRVAAACVWAMRAAGAASLAGPATAFGRDILPRIAALLDLPMLSDVLSVQKAEGRLVFRRSMHAGRILATVEIAGEAGVFSVDAGAFGKPEAVGEISAVEMLPIDAAALPRGTRWVGREAGEQKRPDLTAARVVVAGGRALRDAAMFERLVGGLADRLGGAVGASGGATAADLAPPALLIGQTGTTVAPELYVAVGISGSDQHVAGMRDSKIIVAINRDPDAPIFRIADYGLVADLHAAVPELIEKL